MIVVFFKLPLTLGVFTSTFNVLNVRAATAAAEILNETEWLAVYSS